MLYSLNLSKGLDLHHVLLMGLPQSKNDVHVIAVEGEPMARVMPKPVKTRAVSRWESEQ